MEVFNFGKYKGKKVDEVIKENPEYVDWARNNVEWFSLDVSQEKKLDEFLQFNKQLKKESKSFTHPDMRMFPEDGDYDPESMFGSHRLEMETFFGLDDY